MINRGLPAITREFIDLDTKEWIELTGKRAASRECGTCRLCCKTGSVDEEGVRFQPFRKPAGVMCEFASSKGCSLHEDSMMPRTCSAFLCLWRLGMGHDEHRPDKMKMVPTTQKMPNGTTVAVLHEQYAGSTNKRGHAMLSLLQHLPHVDTILIVPDVHSKRRGWTRSSRGWQAFEAEPVGESPTVDRDDPELLRSVQLAEATVRGETVLTIGEGE